MNTDTTLKPTTNRGEFGKISDRLAYIGRDVAAEMALAERTFNHLKPSDAHTLESQLASHYQNLIRDLEQMRAVLEQSDHSPKGPLQ